MKRAWMAVMVLALAGCGGGNGGWSKPGVTADVAAEDFAACQSQARNATRRDAGIDADIMATRGQDWQRTGTLAIKRDDMANSSRENAKQIIGRCMAAQGYAPTP
jgi:hypothetical protein